MCEGDRPDPWDRHEGSSRRPLRRGASASGLPKGFSTFGDLIFLGISSAGLVQVNGWAASFQPSIQASMVARRSSTEVKALRRMACRVMIAQKHSSGRVAPAHCCAGGPSEPAVPAFRATGSGKPCGLAGALWSMPWSVRRRWQWAYEAGGGAFVRRDRAPGDNRCAAGRRLADGREPLLRLAWALRFLVGVGQQAVAGRAASLLPLELEQQDRARGSAGTASPLGPVGGQCRVVRGRPAVDHPVLDGRSCWSGRGGGSARLRRLGCSWPDGVAAAGW